MVQGLRLAQCFLTGNILLSGAEALTSSFLDYRATFVVGVDQMKSDCWITEAVVARLGCDRCLIFQHAVPLEKKLHTLDLNPNIQLSPCIGILPQYLLSWSPATRPNFQLLINGRWTSSG